MRWIFLLVACLASVRPAVAADAPFAIDVDANGMGRALVDWPREMPVRFGLWVVRDNWTRVDQQWSLKDLTYSPFATSRTIAGRFDLSGAGLSIRQAIDAHSIRYTLKADRRIDTTGVYWFFELPVDQFAGGEVQIGGSRVGLSVDQPAKAALDSGKGSRMTVTSRDGKTRVVVTFPADREVRVQDARVFNEPRYQLYTPLIEAPIEAGKELSVEVTIDATIPANEGAAVVQIDPNTTHNRFDGFGGNFVYAIDDPTTDLALKELKLTWARIGVEAAKWEPTNDNGDPQLTNRAVLAARDVEGSALRKRFELDRKLFELTEGRLIASLWYPPEWMFDTQMQERNQPGRISRERWDELAECITSYLQHLKDQYGVEPALFSFNEPDLGIYVLLDADEQRDLITFLGERFEAAGLKTKLLLGDSADLVKGLEQIQTTLDDAAAMKHVGALAYHPWSGQNEQWPAWSAAATKHNLPLFATELGADAAGWRDGSFNAPLPTLRLARRYVEQLRDARTQSMFEWEWTGDYAMTNVAANGERELANRGRFLRQLTQTTPTNALVVASQCDADSITAAALFAEDERSGVVHLVNQDAARNVEVRGIPRSLKLATLFIIDPLAGEWTPRHIELIDGTCSFELPAGALATLSFPPME